MQFAICRSVEGSPIPPANALEQDGLRWLKFGAEYFFYSADCTGKVDWNRLETAGAAVNMEVRAAAVEPGADSLYLVTQKGRTFQSAHPDVRVLLDKGRHLVVSLAPDRAEKIISHAARYSIRPAIGNETVVERLDRPTTPPLGDDRIKRIIDSISRDSFARTLTELASFPTRHSLTSHFLVTADRLADRLLQMGYQVVRQSVSIPGGETSNVIADKRGVGSGERSLMLVTAHLDSVNHPADHSQPDDPAAPAPGADDNASGSAGLMEIARVLQDKPGAQDLRLVLFGGEEQGLFGSRHFVANLSPQERARIKSVVNMDMIAVVNGTQGPTVLLEGGDPVSRRMITDMSKAAHTYTSLTVNTSLDPHDSDHVPFITAGVPAVLTIEGDDGANGNVHTANDTLDHINHDLALEILRMNTAFVATELGV